MCPLKLFIFAVHLFCGIQALKCGISVAHDHFDEVQQLLLKCVDMKDFDSFFDNFSTTTEFARRNDGPNLYNFSMSLESQSDEADDANPQVNIARIAQMRLRNSTVAENRTDDTTYSTLTSNRGEEIGQQNIPRIRNESFRAQTPIITIQPANTNSSNFSTVTDSSSDRNEGDQTETDATDSSEQSEETNVTDSHCIIRCLLDKMHVVNDNGFPDRQKFADELLKKVSGRDVEEFFRNSINDCYQQIDKTLDSCDFSTELIMCLAEKGKANCDDWPVGFFSYQP